MNFHKTVFAITLITAINACQINSTDSALQLRQMNSAEVHADFEQMVNYIKEFYGPLEYKQRRFGFDFDNLVAQYKNRLAATKSDQQVFGIFREFLSEFQDGHVGIQFYSYAGDILQYRVPLFVTPYYDEESGNFQVLVEKIIEEKLNQHSIAVGDQVVAVDSKPILDYLPKITKYDTTGHSETDRHLIYKIFDRRSYMSDLVPTKDFVQITFKKPDGTIYNENLIWEVKKQQETSFVTDDIPGSKNYFAPLAEQMNVASKRFSFDKFGAIEPFYLNDKTQTTYDIQRVYANDSMLKKYGIEDKTKAPEIFAALYEFNGKTIFIVRNPTYYPGSWEIQMEHMKHYRALLDQYDSVADVLVVDQTHNGGGSYCTEFSQLFLKEEGHGPVQANNADRLWIRNINAWIDGERQSAKEGNRPADEPAILALENMAHQVELAIDSGENLTEQLPFFASQYLKPDSSYHWKKPLLVLADELDGSCADLMPMLIKANNAAKIFGRRTMGLGGNVEKMPELNISGASIRLTRGLFTTFSPTDSYPDEVLIENNGVTPDYEHKISVKDFRNQFTDYVKAFSEKALEQIDQ